MDSSAKQPTNMLQMETENIEFISEDNKLCINFIKSENQYEEDELEKQHDTENTRQKQDFEMTNEISENTQPVKQELFEAEDQQLQTMPEIEFCNIDSIDISELFTDKQENNKVVKQKPHTYTVSQLKKLDFHRLSLEKKLDIKRKGRPTPELHIMQEQRRCKSKNFYCRKFNRNTYNRTSWICGCEKTNSFFCFVCLLFGGSDDWTKHGTNDLKHLTLRVKKHENTLEHRHNLVSFVLLGKSNTSVCSNGVYADEIRRHNEIVTKNRQVSDLL